MTTAQTTLEEPRIWQNRIVGEDEVSPHELIAHDSNWREHPPEQVAAMSSILQRIGVVQRIVVNERTGRVLDGHMRVQLAMDEGVETIPIVRVDLSEEEERRVLASFDTVGALAEANNERLAELLAELSAAGDEGLEALAEEMRERWAIFEEEENFLPDVEAEYAEHDGHRQQGTPYEGENLVTYQIYLIESEHEQFTDAVRALQETWGIDTESATVRRAVLEALS